MKVVGVNCKRNFSARSNGHLTRRATVASHPVVATADEADGFSANAQDRSLDTAQHCQDEEQANPLSSPGREPPPNWDQADVQRDVRVPNRVIAAPEPTAPDQATPRGRCEFPSSTHTRKKRLNSNSSPSSSSRTRTRTRIRQIARTRSRTNSNSENSRRNVGELASEFESLTHKECVTCEKMIDGVLRSSDKGSALK